MKVTIEAEYKKLSSVGQCMITGRSGVLNTLDNSVSHPSIEHSDGINLASATDVFLLCQFDSQRSTVSISNAVAIYSPTDVKHIGDSENNGVWGLSENLGLDSNSKGLIPLLAEEARDTGNPGANVRLDNGTFIPGAAFAPNEGLKAQSFCPGILFDFRNFKKF